MASQVATIDRLSATPYYKQLSDVLEQRITGGALAIGSRLPSEHDLCAEFGLSRATVRQALQALESTGAVERVPGRGVFVSNPEASPGWVIQGTEGFLENAIGHQNRSVKTTVLGSGPSVLPSIAARAFGLAEGTTGFKLVRLRHLDGQPALFSTNYSPPALIPLIENAGAVLDGTASFSALLAGAGFSLGRATRTIVAGPAAKDVAAHLGVPRNAPLINIRSVSWTTDGVCFDLYETWVRSDIIPLEVSVNAVASR